MTVRCSLVGEDQGAPAFVRTSTLVCCKEGSCACLPDELHYNDGGLLASGACEPEKVYVGHEVFNSTEDISDRCGVKCRSNHSSAVAAVGGPAQSSAV